MDSLYTIVQAFDLAGSIPMNMKPPHSKHKATKSSVPEVTGKISGEDTVSEASPLEAASVETHAV
jgi:hypothetical protein